MFQEQELPCGGILNDYLLNEVFFLLSFLHELNYYPLHDNTFFSLVGTDVHFPSDQSQIRRVNCLKYSQRKDIIPVCGFVDSSLK